MHRNAEGKSSYNITQCGTKLRYFVCILFLPISLPFSVLNIQHKPPQPGQEAGLLHGLHGQVLVHGAAAEGGQPVRAAARRVGIHVGVPCVSPPGRRTSGHDLRRDQRDHEGAHRQKHLVATLLFHDDVIICAHYVLDCLVVM